MKSIIVYSSQTGNTRKLAETIKDVLADSSQIYHIEDAPDPSEFDEIYLGFWLMAGKPDPKAQAYLQKVKTQKLFLFATHGAASQSAHAKNAIEAAKKLAPEADIIGTFNCPGEVNPSVLEKVRSKPEPPVWLDDAPDAEGHPDEADLNALRKMLQ